MRVVIKKSAYFLAATALALLYSCAPPETFRGTDVSGVAWGGDFELTAHTGKRLKSSDYRGKLTVLFFGYTHCPDICAPTLAKLAQSLKTLEARADKIQVFFITVDPQHDTPPQLAKFVPTFNPSFIGLTGTETEIASVAKAHNVPFERNAAQAGQFSHSGAVLVKDGKGRMRLILKNDAGVEDIVHDLQLLLWKG